MINLAYSRDVEQVNSIKSGRQPRILLQFFVTAVSLSIYPVYFMWVPLTSTRSRQIGISTSDLNSAILNALTLSYMDVPWDTATITNAPDGENYWRVTHLTQILQHLGLWLFTRIASPSASVAILIVFGWIITGIAVYLWARHLGATRTASIAAGIIAQSLPWLQAKASSHTSYLYIGLILLTWLAFARLGNRSKGRLLIAILMLASTLLFDTYIFYFTFFGLLVFLSVAPQSKKTRRYFQVIFVFLLLISLFFHSFLEYQFNSLLKTIQGTSADGQRIIQLPADSDIAFWSSSTLDYLRPSASHLLFPQPWWRSIQVEFSQDFVNYAGITVVALALMGIVIGLRNGPRRLTCAWSMVIVVFFLLSTNIRLNIGAFSSPSLTEIVTLFMPGARVFSRAGLVVEVALCIFVAVALTYAQRRIKSQSLGNIIVIGVTAVCLIDLNPVGGRVYLTESSKYDVFNNALSASDSPRVLFLPPYGRWYIDNSFIGTETVNSFESGGVIDRIFAEGQGDLRMLHCALNREGVTHIFGPVVDGKLIPETMSRTGDLKKIASLITSNQLQGSYSNEKIFMGLFLVNPIQFDQSFSYCDPD